MPVLRALAATTVVFVLAMLTACGTPGGGDGVPEVSLEELTRQTLGALPAVAALDVKQMPVGGSQPTDRSDPDLWTLDIAVEMSDDATPEQVASAADATRAFATAHVGSARWVAHLTVGAMRPVPDKDRTAPSPIQIQVYPATRGSAADDVRDALAVQSIPNVQHVAIAGEQPLVEVASAADLPVAIDQLRQLPLWSEGGILQADGGRIQLTDVPDRVTSAQIHAIIDAGAAYPRADFALQASGDSPELYVNRVTVKQARALTSSLTAPALAHSNGDGFVLEFNIRASDANRTVDSHGTFGQRSAG